MQKNSPSETGSNRLGVDFGTGFTVVTVRDERDITRVYDFATLSRPFPIAELEHYVSRLPSQIRYNEDGTWSIGKADLTERMNTTTAVRGLRHYILEGSTVQVPRGGGLTTGYMNAGSDFLSALLNHISHNGTDVREVVFSVPVNSPRQYSVWLRDVAAKEGFRVPFLIDEPCAAVKGYGLTISPGSLFILFDFHQYGLDITLATPHEISPETGGLFSRVLGTAHDERGGSLIDTWMVKDLLSRNRLHESDPRVARLLPGLTNDVGRAREALNLNSEAVVSVTDTGSGFSVTAKVTRDDICRNFEERGVFTAVNQALDRALSGAGIRDAERKIEALVMVGECSAIPCVQEALIARWGSKVHCNHPVDAIARGAAMADPETLKPDRIRNDYAIRHWDPGAQEYRYRFIVRNGTRYPSAGQVARIVISGAYDGQEYLGIPLCEIGTLNQNHHGHIELISNKKGEVQIAEPAQGIVAEMCPVLMNGPTPVLLHASPPAKKGEPRFELTFSLDRQGYLCLTARDLLSGILVKRDTQLFRLN